jgi:hypothetical protein
VWPKAQRKLWLQLLEGSFELIYKDAGPIGPKTSKESSDETMKELERSGEWQELK